MFVSIALYQEKVSEFFLRQLNRLYPKQDIFIITRQDNFVLFETIGAKNITLIDESSVISHGRGGYYLPILLNCCRRKTSWKPKPHNPQIGCGNSF